MDKKKKKLVVELDRAKQKTAQKIQEQFGGSLK